jgi:hypothetical protein
MKSPFASPSITIHLARGASAALLGFLAMLSLHTMTLGGSIGAVIAAGGALFMLRGCPMCWTLGLFETVANRIAQRAAPPRVPQARDSTSRSPSRSGT